mmetsp:Transcript_7657/g.16333  ORF Transcript_7657/g.16333 Transcript_7657/m.16333 type:complete len:91 (-) Transcript_7657:186-458(-)
MLAFCPCFHVLALILPTTTRQKRPAQVAVCVCVCMISYSRALSLSLLLFFTRSREKFRKIQEPKSTARTGTNSCGFKFNARLQLILLLCL